MAHLVWGITEFKTCSTTHDSLVYGGGRGPGPGPFFQTDPQTKYEINQLKVFISMHCLYILSTNSASVQRQEEDKREKERRQKEQQRLTAAQTRGEAKQKVIAADKASNLDPIASSNSFKIRDIYIYSHIRCALFEIVQSY